jgi:hypothetical protein
MDDLELADHNQLQQCEIEKKKSAYATTMSEGRRNNTMISRK